MEVQLAGQLGVSRTPVKSYKKIRIRRFSCYVPKKAYVANMSLRCSRCIEIGVWSLSLHHFLLER